jgi:phosphoribosylanthranilate isomerase
VMVKICGITRREDAEAAVEAGAAALGFVFYPPSPRYVTPERAAELGEGLPILKVGVFQDETAASIEAAVSAAKLDIAQIYNCAAPGGVQVWTAFRIIPGLGAFAGPTGGTVVLDGPANGIPFDWSVAQGLGLKIVLAGGLDAANVGEAIRAVKPWGVDASSKLESSPGIKDHKKVRQFVQASKDAARKI